MEIPGQKKSHIDPNCIMELRDSDKRSKIPKIMQMEKRVVVEKSVKKVVTSGTLQEDSEKRYLGGSILCCDSISNSDVFQGNNKFWYNLDSNVSDRVWEAISNMGVVRIQNKPSIVQNNKDLEARDILKKGNRKESKKKPLGILFHTT